MKYSPHIYAKALAEVIADATGKSDEEQNAIVHNFIALVRKNGDEAHLRKFVEEAARFARGKSGIRKVTIESARPLTAIQRSVLQQFLKEGDVVEENIDSELIAGVKILLNDEQQFDGSLKGKIDKLFGTT